MKRITFEELPDILTSEYIDILVEMSNEFPLSEEWREIYDKLPSTELLKIGNRNFFFISRKRKAT